jgi:hypothetical protein
MSKKIEAPIQADFDYLKESRRTYLNDHPSINNIIALCVVIAGTEEWTYVENFGQQKHPLCQNRVRHFPLLI